MRPQPGFSFSQGGGAAAAPTPGPNRWPQPAFAASTGLTLQNCTVTGVSLLGAITGGAGACIGVLTGDPIVVGQTWRISGSMTLITDPFTVRVGCAANSLGGTQVVDAITSTGPFSFDVLITAVNTNSRIAFVSATDTFSMASFSAQLLS